MNIKLTAQQIEARQQFRAFAEATIRPDAARYEQEQSLPSSLIACLASAGYLGAAVPRAHGGQEMDMITYGLLNEELGRVSSSVRSLVMVQNMVAHTIARWGSPEQRACWPGRIARGETVASLALTEPEAGSDVKEVQTEASRRDDHYLLSGHKRWITFGQIAALFLVLARHEGRLTAFLLPRESPGLTITPMCNLSGVRATMLAELTLADCPVPAANVVGTVGFGLAPVVFTALDLGRYSIAWGCVGLAQDCLDASVAYASSRHQFGVPLLQHQLIQEMITDMIVNIRAARLLCYQAGCLREEGDPDAFIEAMIAKYFASTMATRVANNAVQIHGAIGFQDDHPVQRHLRDARTMEIIEGSTQIHQIKIAEYSHQAYRQGRPASNLH